MLTASVPSCHDSLQSSGQPPNQLGCLSFFSFSFSAQYPLPCCYPVLFIAILIFRQCPLLYMLALTRMCLRQFSQIAVHSLLQNFNQSILASIRPFSMYLFKRRLSLRRNPFSQSLIIISGLFKLKKKGCAQRERERGNRHILFTSFCYVTTCVR